VLPLGVRIDVSKARDKAIPFYLKMGYLFVRDSAFDFGLWQARCGLIAYPADSRHPGRFADVFAGLSDPCELRDGERFTASYRDVVAALRDSPEPSKEECRAVGT
jgi:hypothetical protein